MPASSSSRRATDARVAQESRWSSVPKRSVRAPGDVTTSRRTRATYRTINRARYAPTSLRARAAARPPDPIAAEDPRGRTTRECSAGTPFRPIHLSRSQAPSSCSEDTSSCSRRYGVLPARMQTSGHRPDDVPLEFATLGRSDSHRIGRRSQPASPSLRTRGTFQLTPGFPKGRMTLRPKDPRVA